MPIMRVTKRYNAKSPLNGVIAMDKIPFATYQDGARWMFAVNAGRMDFDVVDYEWVLVDLAQGEHVVASPTGFTGKLQ